MIHTRLMQALVYTEPRNMMMQEVPQPEPKDNEVLIQVEKVGICGSELSGYLGENSLRKPPLIMGHEFAGIVVQGASVSDKYRPGQRVTVNPLISCGRCQHCLSGEQHLCLQRQLLGAHRPGAFAEYIAVPEQNVYPIADDLSMEKAALTEPMACAVHVGRLLQMDPEHDLLIVGAGPIGLLVLQVAHIYGLRNVVVMDVHPDRLKMVKDLGGIPVSDPEQLNEHRPGRGFDVAVDAVGKTSTRKVCLQSLNNGGTVVFTGLHESDSLLPVNEMIRKEMQVLGAFAYTPNDFETALRLNHEQRLTLTPWTRRTNLSKGNECFDALISGQERMAKILLHPGNEVCKG